MDTLTVLDWDHSVTQRSMLPERKFVEECRARDLHIDQGGLESMHRQGIILPFYSIRYVAADVVRRVRVLGESLAPARIQLILRSVSTERLDLIEERRLGDLVDPARDRYRPWSIAGTFRSTPYLRRRWLYSPYQLLGLREILQMCPDRDPRTLEGPRGRRGFSRSIKRHVRQLGARQRDLAVVLTLLEAAYLPVARPSLRGFFDEARWSRYRSEFRVEDAIQAADSTADDLVSAADRLLWSAHGFDPLAKWSDLVGLVHFSMWDQLGGLAMLAIDHRIAAEMLLLAREDLARRGLAKELDTPTSGWWSPFDYRIGVPRDRLNGTLTRFGISPHPSVLLVMEGKIDRLAVIGYLDLRLRKGWRNAIQVIDSEGVDNDVSLVATLVAPLAGATEGDLVTLDRPPTRILIVVDPEGSMRTEQGRSHIRDRWIDRLFTSLPEDLQVPAVRADLGGLVEIEIWDEAGNSFEFAHFSDAQIAAAIHAISMSPSLPALPDLERAVTSTRIGRRNLKSVWSKWTRPHPTKMRLFRQLEPEFQAAVSSAIAEGADPPSYPAARVIVRLLRLAGGSRRQTQTVLRLGTTIEADSDTGDNA